MLYSRALLEQRIKEEKLRTYRTGSPFSLILFHPFRLISEGYRSRKRAIAWMVKLWHQETRETDIKGWWDKTTLGIIVLDTLPDDALMLVDKVVSKIEENGYALTWSNEKAPFEIYNFPNSHQRGQHSRANKKSKDSGKPRNKSNHNSDNLGSLIEFPDRDFSSLVKRVAKRTLDIGTALLGIIIAFPLMLIIAVVIKVTSPGPVLFRQERIGFLGRTFTFLKFRTMSVDADQNIHEAYITDLINGQNGKINRGTGAQPLYKMSDDPRVTSVGRILRKTSLDELPQLFNILKGDMSLVGPRPPIPYEVEKYRLWHCGRVFEVKPGLTGLWQVSGRSQTSFDDMVRLDLHYAHNWSLWLDIKIIFKTFRAVLSTAGAY
jgi:lipopolysaccharide/colanic/teichoic acid biosynthesis glycosyltransferase